MGIIEAAKLAFEYKSMTKMGKSKRRSRAVDSVDLDVKKRRFCGSSGA